MDNTLFEELQREVNDIVTLVENRFIEHSREHCVGPELEVYLRKKTLTTRKILQQIEAQQQS